MNGTPHRRRILVVDDDQDNASILSMLLENDGHDVRVATDGAGALEEARRATPELAILDLGLHDTSGLEVARELRRAAGGAPLVLAALTGWDGADVSEQCREAGFDCHLVKPIQDLAIVLELARTLEVPATGRL